MPRVPAVARPILALIALVAVVSAGVTLGAAVAAQTPEVEVTVATGPGESLAFDPSSVAVRAGTTVRITLANRSSQAHNLTFEGPISGATRTIVEAGETDVVVIRPPGSGRYPFVCTIHVGMAGTLAVN